jgi:hypothetical protein
MIAFEEIESAFLKIEPLDYAALSEFYHVHKTTLWSALESKSYEKEVSLKILMEIICANSFEAKHNEALFLYGKIKPYLTTSSNTNNLFFCVAQSYYALKNYWLALVYFKKYKPTQNQKKDFDLIVSICNKEIVKKVLLYLSFIGYLLIAIKYITLWFFNNNYNNTISLLGLIGVVLLLPYYLFINLKK